jgi:hypothetical protein
MGNALLVVCEAAMATWAVGQLPTCIPGDCDGLKRSVSFTIDVPVADRFALFVRGPGIDCDSFDFVPGNLWHLGKMHSSKGKH